MHTHPMIAPVRRGETLPTSIQAASPAKTPTSEIAFGQAMRAQAPGRAAQAQELNSAVLRPGTVREDSASRRNARQAASDDEPKVQCGGSGRETKQKTAKKSNGKDGEQAQSDGVGQAAHGEETIAAPSAAGGASVANMAVAAPAVPTTGNHQRAKQQQGDQVQGFADGAKVGGIAGAEAPRGKGPAQVQTGAKEEYDTAAMGRKKPAQDTGESASFVPASHAADPSAKDGVFSAATYLAGRTDHSHQGIESGVLREESRVSGAEAPTSRSVRTENTFEGKTIVATPHVLEVEMQSESHGWLRVRAELGRAGEVTASVAAASPAAGQTLLKDLSSLSAYLRDEQVGVSSLVVHSSERSAGMGGGGAAQGSKQEAAHDRSQNPKNRDEEVNRGGNGWPGPLAHGLPFAVGGAVVAAAGLMGANGNWLSVRV